MVYKHIIVSPSECRASMICRMKKRDSSPDRTINVGNSDIPINEDVLTDPSGHGPLQRRVCSGHERIKSLRTLTESRLELQQWGVHGRRRSKQKQRRSRGAEKRPDKSVDGNGGRAMTNAALEALSQARLVPSSHGGDCPCSDAAVVLPAAEPCERRTPPCTVPHAAHEDQHAYASHLPRVTPSLGPVMRWRSPSLRVCCRLPASWAPPALLRAS